MRLTHQCDDAIKTTVLSSRFNLTFRLSDILLMQGSEILWVEKKRIPYKTPLQLLAPDKKVYRLYLLFIP